MTVIHHRGLASRIRRANVARFFFVVASAFLVLAAMIIARSVLLPIVTAVLLTFILAPLVIFLQSKGLPRVVAVLLVVILVFLVLGGIVVSIVHQMNGLAAELPRYRHQILEKLESMRHVGEDTVPNALLDLIKDMSRVFSDRPGGQPVPEGAPVPVVVESSSFPFYQSIAGSTLELVLNFGLVLLLVIFMLLQREDLRNRMVRLIGRSHLRKTIKALDDSSKRISRYLLMQLLVNFFFGSALAIGLSLIGVPYAPVWGFMGALLRYVPYLGPVLASVFPLTLAWAVFPDWTPFFLVAGYIAVLEAVCGNVLEPLLYGHSIGVSTVAFLSMAVFWTWAWGPMGLVLATPMTALLVVFSRHFSHLEAINILLSDDAVMEPPLAFYQRLLANDRREATDIVQNYLKTHDLKAVYENLFVRAVQTLRVDRRRGAIADNEEGSILQLAREILVEAVFPLQDALWAKKDNVPSSAGDGAPPRPLIVALPSRPEDEIILEMFKETVDPGKFQFTVLNSAKLLSEMLEEIARMEPAMVILGTCCRTFRARNICKRLRKRFPNQRFIVAIWDSDIGASARKSWQAAGANQVAASFEELASRLMELRAPARNLPNSGNRLQPSTV